MRQKVSEAAFVVEDEAILKPGGCSMSPCGAKKGS